jgi:hypothetical protein
MFLGLVPSWVLGALLPLMSPVLDYGSEWEAGEDQDIDYDDSDVDFGDADL